MAWTTPTLVEICIGLEINGYLPAEFDRIGKSDPSAGGCCVTCRRRLFVRLSTMPQAARWTRNTAEFAPSTRSKPPAQPLRRSC